MTAERQAGGSARLARLAACGSARQAGLSSACASEHAGRRLWEEPATTHGGGGRRSSANSSVRGSIPAAVWPRKERARRGTRWRFGAAGAAAQGASGE